MYYNKESDSSWVLLLEFHKDELYLYLRNELYLHSKNLVIFQNMRSSYILLNFNHILVLPEMKLVKNPCLNYIPYTIIMNLTSWEFCLINSIKKNGICIWLKLYLTYLDENGAVCMNSKNLCNFIASEIRVYIVVNLNKIILQCTVLYD